MNQLKITKTIILASLLVTIFQISASADIAVIVHPDNNAVIGSEEVRKIFIDITRRYTNGSIAIPVNQPDKSIARIEFEKEFLKMDRRQLKQYWANLIFSGRGITPRELKNDTDIVKFVSRNPNAIGYVDFRFVDDSVNVIFTRSIYTSR